MSPRNNYSTFAKVKLVMCANRFAYFGLLCCRYSILIYYYYKTKISYTTRAQTASRRHLIIIIIIIVIIIMYYYRRVLVFRLYYIRIDAFACLRMYRVYILLYYIVLYARVSLTRSADQLCCAIYTLPKGETT